MFDFLKIYRRQLCCLILAVFIAGKIINIFHLCLPQVSSQHPYAEQYIGRPHVITIDFNNSEEFDATIREIMRINVRSFFCGCVCVCHPILTALIQQNNGGLIL